MNIRSIYLAGLFAIIGSHIINTNAQQLRNPFDFPILLSGNFGELRSNHFHSGIDFKTQGVEGKPRTYGTRRIRITYIRKSMGLR